MTTKQLPAVDRGANVRKSVGALYRTITSSKVLMVGAGGIGCELLKNLVLTGFGEIHIVDLDTIDLSNLNRQFLFGMEHIKKPKAIVAKETAQKFNPDVELIAYHSNIKDDEFNVEWYKTFDIVFNALDNLEARRHVNKMCLMANVPLIESGTTGFFGQVQAIKRGETECYDCNPKPVPKSFPVCTIRSTPSQPIHCIVWAKNYLFTEVFGTGEEDTNVLDNSTNAENAEEIETLKREANELKRIREQIGTETFARAVFEKVFHTDIERLRSMEDMWKTRKPPTALSYDEVAKLAKDVPKNKSTDDLKVWDLAENFAVFVDSIDRLTARVAEEKEEMKDEGATPVLSFDKDDVDTLDFVAAAANIRSIIFNIDVKSKFDIKQMAGNIIPAIATTNAITAGLCVLQAFKVMKNSMEDARTVFLSKSADRVFTTEKPGKPNPTCTVCSVSYHDMEVDLKRAKLQDIITYLQKVVGYGEELSVNIGSKVIYDADFDDNAERTLEHLGVTSGSPLKVKDEDDLDEDKPPHTNLELRFIHKEFPSDQSPLGDAPAIVIPRAPRVKKEEKPTNGVENGDMEVDTSQPVSGIKRKRELSDVEIRPGLTIQERKKRQRKEDDIIVLEEEEGDGIIEID